MMERSSVDDRDGLVNTAPDIDMQYLLSGAPSQYDPPTPDPDTVWDDDMTLDEMEDE